MVSAGRERIEREETQALYDFAVTRVFRADGSVEREIELTKAAAEIVFSSPSWVPEWGCTREEYESLRALPVDTNDQPTGPWQIMSSADYIAATRRGERFIQERRVECGGRKWR